MDNHRFLRLGTSTSGKASDKTRGYLEKRDRIFHVMDMGLRVGQIVAA